MMDTMTEFLAGVKALQEAFPVVNTLASGAAGGLITHLLARRLDDRKYQREQAAAEEKRKTELQFISVELIYLLEDWARQCHLQLLQYKQSMQPSIPVPDFSSVKGNWQALPVTLIYRIRELPAETEEVRRQMESYRQTKWMELVIGVQSETFLIKAALKAIRLARRLRRDCGFPATRLAGHENSVHQYLWMEYRRPMRARAEAYVMPVSEVPRPEGDLPAPPAP